MWIWAGIGVAFGQGFTVAPFVQAVGTDEAWVVWEVADGADGEVQWGASADALDQRAASVRIVSEGEARIHEAHLVGLQPGQRVFYRVSAGEGAVSAVHDFLTAPAPGTPTSFRLLAMSDMQQAALWPNKFREVVHDGVLRWLEGQGQTDLASSFGMILVPGDLVDDGPQLDQWRETFFAPLHPLSAHVPLWPVYGNHEDGTHWFNDFFHLPDNGDATWSEHWWATRYANLEVIGLDSNLVGQWTAQMDFLQARLDAACADDSVDFVLAQLHHPFESEAWTPGNNFLVGTLVERMSAFSTACGKPSVHLFGHTHAYSRGQARDHAHLMVNVATAGGAIDRWGEHAQADYPAFSVSEDDWGFVVLDVTGAPDPTLTVTRVSRGDAQTPVDNEVRDRITLRRNNAAPAAPAVVAPVDGASGDCVTLGAVAFVDPDGDAHQATHWQVAAGGDWERPVVDRWRQDRNLFLGVDTQATDDLLDEALTDLPAGTWTARARVRDAALAWSEWSAPVTFTVAAPVRTTNLLPDPGAEAELDGWTVEGHVEVTADGRCGAALPVDGARAIGLGGPCVPQPGGRLVTEIGLAPHRERLAAGAPLRWSALAMGDGASLTWTFETLTGEVLATATDPLPAAVTWTPAEGSHDVPAGADLIRLVVTAAGAAQLDALDARLGDAPGACAEPAWPDPPTDGADGEGCGGCTQGSGSGVLPALLAFVGRASRRRRPGDGPHGVASWAPHR